MRGVEDVLPKTEKRDGQKKLQGKSKIVANLNRSLIEAEQKRDDNAEDCSRTEHGEASHADANGERDRQPGGGRALAQDVEQMTGDRF